MPPIKLEIEGKKYVAYLEQSEGEKTRSFRPKKNTVVYVLTGNEGVTDILYSDSTLQRNFSDMGHIFLTRVEAERELVYRQALQRVKEWIYEQNAGKEWKVGTENYSVYWNEVFVIEHWLNNKCFSPFGYLNSREACRQLIREMDSDLRIIFNV